MTSTTTRLLDPSFLDALEGLAVSKTDNWWRDILGHRELVLAVRRNSINAYYRGASVFRIDWKAGQLSPVTHVKYLVTPAQDYIRLNSDGTFELTGVEPVALRYLGRQTLEAMLVASAKYSGAEKSGLHPMLLGNSSVIDVEVALSRSGTVEDSVQEDTSEAVGKADRIDAAIAVLSAEGTPEIRFFEAKHFTNSALRASGATEPKVIRQVANYEKALTKHALALSARYFDTSQAFLRFNKMRVNAFGEEAARDVSPAVRKIAETGLVPAISNRPHLLIYGFDKAQRDDSAWQMHLAKLEAALPGRVLAVGNPTRKTSFSR
jgi:hypothetical protein